jgi:hypothetical protein
LRASGISPWKSPRAGIPRLSRLSRRPPWRHALSIGAR